MVSGNERAVFLRPFFGRVVVRGDFLVKGGCMKWYRVVSFLSAVISMHMYSAEQISLKSPQRRSSIVAKRVRCTRSLLLMTYNQRKTKIEHAEIEAQEEQDCVQDTLPPKSPFKSADLPALIKTEHISHELDLKTACSHGSSSRGSSAASSPNESPSGSPREDVVLAEPKESKRV